MYDFVLAENEYMFYLVTATLAFGTGVVLNPSVVTHFCAAGTTTGDVPKPKKVACGAATSTILAEGAASSRLKRKRSSVAAQVCCIRI